MKNIFIFQEKGEGFVNEDVCGYIGQFAWVIDGATDVFKRNRLFEKDVR